MYNHGPYFAAFLIRLVWIRPTVFSFGALQERKVTSGGCVHDSNSIRVNSVIGGMVANVSNGGADLVMYHANGESGLCTMHDIEKRVTTLEQPRGIGPGEA